MTSYGEPSNETAAASKLLLAEYDTGNALSADRANGQLVCSGR